MIFIIMLNGGSRSLSNSSLWKRIKLTITNKIIWKYYTSLSKPASTLVTNDSKESIIALTPL